MRAVMWLYASSDNLITRRYLAKAVIVDGVRYELKGPIAWWDGAGEREQRAQFLAFRKAATRYLMECHPLMLARMRHRVAVVK